MPNVAFQHPDYRDMFDTWTSVDDCIAGEQRVKYRKTKYLPQPNAEDQSRANQVRYNAYLTRAVFYNVSRRTLAGLVGTVFEVDPVMKIPDTLKPVVQDASGSGISLEQLAERAVRLGMKHGRLGLLVDFPDVPVGISVEQASKIQPTITAYNALEIINWRVQEIDGKDVTTLIVLTEKYPAQDDGFEITYKVQYRALRLINGIYSVQIWRDNRTTPYREMTPKKADGSPWDYIPFFFIGSENNDADVDDAPMYDMCSINLAHYRNSADFEEAAYILGQPTPWVSGVTESWVENVFKGPIQLGARAIIPLPVNGNAGILQPQETTMAFDAMEHKEQQMIALGARLVQNKEVERTKYEAQSEDATQTSILANVAKNVSAGITSALRACLLFLPGMVEPSETELFYRLNTQFKLAGLSTEELQAVISAWQDGALTWKEMRDRMRYARLATEADDKAKTEIEADQAKADAREVKKTADLAKAAPKPTVGTK
jgi:hypothetical protein